MKKNKKINIYIELNINFKCINWVEEFEELDVDVCYEKFLRKCESGCDKYIPTLILDENKAYYNRHSPWMSKELRTLCQEKKKLV